MPSSTTGANRETREKTSTIEIPAMVASRQKPSGTPIVLPETVSGGTAREVLEAFKAVLSQSDTGTYNELQAHSKSEALPDQSDIDEPIRSWEYETQNDLKTIGGTFIDTRERSGRQKALAPRAKADASGKTSQPNGQKRRFSFLTFLFPKRVKKKRKMRFRPTPPGQKLIKGVVVASILILVQALFHLGMPVDLTLGHTQKIDLQPPFQLTTPLTDLQDELSALNKVKTIDAGVFAINLDNGQYVNSNGEDKFSSASMIKLPILVSFLMAVERGECSMDDELEIRQDLITSGSGFLQWKPVGTKISARRAAQLMIVVSDNTATNMLIDKLGGFEHVNKDFHRWGLKQTKVNNWLVDVEGANTTCPYDLVYLLGRVDHGELVNPEHRAFMYDIMAHCKNRSLLVPGLGPGATIIHKTGTIGIMVGDAGIVTTSGGTRYAVSIQCQRDRNNTHANNLIREMSKRIYRTYALQPPPAKSKLAQAATAEVTTEPVTEVSTDEPVETPRPPRKRKRRK